MAETAESGPVTITSWAVLERMAERRTRRLKRSRTIYLSIIMFLTVLIALLLVCAFLGVDPESDGSLTDVMLSHLGMGHPVKLVLSATPLAGSALVLVNTVVNVGHMLEDMEMASMFIQSRDNQWVAFWRVKGGKVREGPLSAVADFFSA